MSVYFTVDTAKNGKKFIQTSPTKIEVGQTVTVEKNEIVEAPEGASWRQVRKMKKNGELKVIGYKSIEMKITGAGEVFSIDGTKMQRFYGEVIESEVSA